MTSRLTAAGLVALAILAVIFGSAALGRHDGIKAAERKAAPVIAGLQSDLAQCRATVATQGAALTEQNAAIDRLQAEGIARAKVADVALRKAQGEAQRYRDRARQIAATQPVGDQCIASRALIVQTLSEERH